MKTCYNTPPYARTENEPNNLTCQAFIRDNFVGSIPTQNSIVQIVLIALNRNRTGINNGQTLTITNAAERLLGV